MRIGSESFFAVSLEALTCAAKVLSLAPLPIRVFCATKVSLLRSLKHRLSRGERFFVAISSNPRLFCSKSFFAATLIALMCAASFCFHPRSIHRAAKPRLLRYDSWARLLSTSSATTSKTAVVYTAIYPKICLCVHRHFRCTSSMKYQ